jgi:hypothetical protein
MKIKQIARINKIKSKKNMINSKFNAIKTNEVVVLLFYFYFSTRGTVIFYYYTVCCNIWRKVDFTSH